MAQSGFTAIQLYSSPTPGATPAASNLTSGELAINAADGKLFYKDTAGNTQVIANSAYSSFSAFSSGVALQGSGTSVVATGTIQFANSNGVSFGLNGSTMTASVAADANSFNIISAGGNTAGALTTFAASTVVLAGGDNITLSQNSNTISINAGGAVTFSAGTTSTATNSLVFSSAGGVSFGINNNTITAKEYVSRQAVMAQLQGWVYTQTSAPDVNVVYPLFVRNDGRFQFVSQPLNMGNSNKDSASIVFSTSVNTTELAFTHGVSIAHNVSTLTGDTLNSYANFIAPISLLVAQSTVYSTGAGNRTATLNYTASLVFPYATSTNGLAYSTLTGTGIFTGVAPSTNPAITITANKQSAYISAIANAALYINGPRPVIAALSAPTVFPAGVYIVGNGTTTARTAGTAITYGGAADNIYDVANPPKFSYVTGAQSLNQGFSKAVLIESSPFGNTGNTPLSAFDGVLISATGTNFTITGYNEFSNVTANSLVFNTSNLITGAHITSVGVTANSGNGFALRVPLATFFYNT